MEKAMEDADQSPAVAGQVERSVRPRAWEVLGGYLYGNEEDAKRRSRKEGGAHFWPLYDRASLDAAVAKERERCASMAENYDLGTIDGHAIARCIRGA
jgi:hypothetical protein